MDTPGYHYQQIDAGRTQRTRNETETTYMRGVSAGVCASVFIGDALERDHFPGPVPGPGHAPHHRVVPADGTLLETPASPSVKCTRGRRKNTLRSLPRVQHSGKSLRGCLSRERALPRVPKIVHSGKTSPSAVTTLGEELTPSVLSAVFFENPLPGVQHLGKSFIFF
jgi:hypothetical protein